jgi:hypothetical protein
MLRAAQRHLHFVVESLAIERLRDEQHRHLLDYAKQPSYLRK